MSATWDKKLAKYKSEGIDRIKLAITDIDGVLRGKYLSLEKFEGLISGTGGFCDCVFGWDINDVLYDNTKFTGWHTAYPDALYRIDLNSERRIPGENIPFFVADFVDKDGKSSHPICPRNVLKRVLARAEKDGFNVNLAFEYEFFLFDETPHSVREKGYKNLKPFTPGMFGYSVIRNSVHGELNNKFMDYCRDFDFSLEGLHCETGPGVWEAAIRYDEALKACDKASLFKTFTKVFFQKHGLMATFMAKWNRQLPGQSGHIHQSLFKGKKSMFYEASAKHHMSPTMSQYVAGQLKYLKSFMALTTPNINSYTRLVKGFWAPTATTWGVENRTTALRVIPGSEKSQRLEFRLGSADANPYLAAAACVASGLLGIEEKLKLEDAVQGNAYEVQDKLPKSRQLPSHLREAAELLKSSNEAKEMFGAEFVDHYVRTREWEVNEYDKAITDWQMERYFEIV